MGMQTPSEFNFVFHIIILKHIYISSTEEIIEEKILKKVPNLAP